MAHFLWGRTWSLRLTFDEWHLWWGVRSPRVPGIYAIGWDVRVWQVGPLAVFRNRRPGEE